MTGAHSWLIDSESRGLSPRTVEARQSLVSKLRWHLETTEAEHFGADQVRAFMAHLQHGHTTDGGRWGNGRPARPIKPRTAKTYWLNLNTLCAFLVAERLIATSPMAGLKGPVVNRDQIQPFTPQQVDALFTTAQAGRHPRRDLAVITLLLDTGIRSSELCSLDIADISFSSRMCSVIGKGSKTRRIHFGTECHRSLWNYLREREVEGSSASEEPLFISDSGKTAGERLTRSGLQQMITKLGRAAQLQAVRCSPHTFRHTFAVEFIRDGGSMLALQEILGHTSLDMVKRYVKLAQADVATEHRRHSPADRRKRRSR